MRARNDLASRKAQGLVAKLVRRMDEQDAELAFLRPWQRRRKRWRKKSTARKAKTLQMQRYVLYKLMRARMHRHGKVLHAYAWARVFLWHQIA